MKKFSVFVLVAMCVLLLSACAPAKSAAIQGLNQLPEEGVRLVFFLVSAGLIWLLLKLSEVTGIDLKGYAPTIAVMLAPILTALLESYLQLIPPIYDNIVLTVIHLIVLLVGSLGTFLGTLFLVKRRAPSLR